MIEAYLTLEKKSFENIFHMFLKFGDGTFGEERSPPTETEDFEI